MDGKAKRRMRAQRQSESKNKEKNVCAWLAEIAIAHILLYLINLLKSSLAIQALTKVFDSFQIPRIFFYKNIN